MKLMRPPILKILLLTKKALLLKKLDGVGPVDNRPSSTLSEEEEEKNDM